MNFNFSSGDEDSDDEFCFFDNHKSEVQQGKNHEKPNIREEKKTSKLDTKICFNLTSEFELELKN
jgi:hypothetical protein